MSKEALEPEILAALFDQSQQREKRILAQFSPEQIEIIKSKQKTLSSLAYFIGRDFNLPIELGLPTPDCLSGWQQGVKTDGTQYLQMNAYDLLEKPIDFLRFVICHEGGHRRISRTDFISLEEWKQLGFSFMMNAIEDPRDNNFVADSYPRFREQMNLAYAQELDFEAKAEEKASQKLGYQPRFMQAGFEYIKQWFRETQGQEIEISADLPDEVKAVVQSTIEHARDSWWRYPSREEADKSEELIKKYAKVSYEINRDKIWPEFKKLIEADMEDQKVQEFLKDMQKGQQQQQEGGEGSQGLSQELKDKLTPEEQKALEEAAKKAIEDAKKEQKKKAQLGTESEGQEQKGLPSDQADTLESVSSEALPNKPIDLSSLSEELRQKIKEYVSSLPEDQQKEMAQKAQATMKEFEDSLSEELQGKLSDNPEQKVVREQEAKEEEQNQQSQGGASIRTGALPKEPLDTENLRVYRERLKREINKDENVYQKYRAEISPLIEKLEAELRQILVNRRITKWSGGFKTGKRIDIKKRLQERGQQISAMESKAWQKRERPDEKDYAISLLVDLSGSMREKVGKDRKIDETFKSVIVLAEALNRLGVNLEVIGFNDDVYEYQNFGQVISKEVREHMGGMFKEVEDSCCTSCGNEHSETDLGWAIKVASERLVIQKAIKKLMIVLTDGKLAESTKHPREQFNPDKIQKEILEQTDVILFDLGTIAGKTVEQIIEELKALMEENL